MVIIYWWQQHPLKKICGFVFDPSVCQSTPFITKFAFRIDIELIHNPQKTMIAEITNKKSRSSHTTNNYHQTVSMWEALSFYVHCATVLTEKLCWPYFLFSNLCYFVYDLFPSITCRISMHSTLRVITSHPVSSPWLHLSSLHLFFNVIFSFSPLISCAHLKSLLSTRLSVCLAVTNTHI